jgi:predicted transposase/invertase (TIGR01784 family)
METCQGENGDRFIVEIQKAKQNFFKDRSVYYASFPIQEQALQGNWDYRLAPVYTVGVLDFVFDDHKHQSTLIHTVELKDQNCQVFYDKLRFIYIELPKFTKTLEQLQTHLDKWLFLLRHLPDLTDRPEPLQEEIFNQLFDVAEIANFSRTEQDSYQNSLKYYRDLNNVVDTARQAGMEAERELNRQRQSALVMRLLVRRLGGLPDAVQQQVNQLSQDRLDRLAEAVFELANSEDLLAWLNRHDGG